MAKLTPWFALAALVLLGGAGLEDARAHCEVPCGIYDDPARFVAMLEDTATIEKAMGQIQALAQKTDAQSLNQAVRWVTTKEDHATRTMDTIGQYFMAQRIKPGGDGGEERYMKLLTSAHAVIRHAMKCKQTVDVGNAKALREAILAFRKAYDSPK